MLSMLDIVWLSVAAIGFLCSIIGFVLIKFDSRWTRRRIEAMYNSHVEAQ